MPTYNASSYVADAIESILRQTFRSFELIVVDDGSTDDTAEIVSGYAERDRRVQPIFMHHAGVSAAMNRGIEATRKEWVAVMHADDVASPRRLETQLRAAREQPEVVTWGSFAEHINDDGRALSLSATGPTSVKAFEARRRTGRPVLIVHSSAFIRRDALVEIGGYDERFNTCEDLDLFDRLTDLGPIVVLPEPLIQRRIHATSNTMRTYSRMHQLARYVAERRRCRNAGQPVPVLAAFLTAEDQRPFPQRVNEWIADTSRLEYHRAAISYGCRRYVRSALHFACSVALSPSYAVPRVWSQLITYRPMTGKADVAPTQLAATHRETYVPKSSIYEAA